MKQASNQGESSILRQLGCKEEEEKNVCVSCMYVGIQLPSCPETEKKKKTDESLCDCVDQVMIMMTMRRDLWFLFIAIYFVTKTWLAV